MLEIRHEIYVYLHTCVMADKDMYIRHVYASFEIWHVSFEIWHVCSRLEMGYMYRHEIHVQPCLIYGKPRGRSIMISMYVRD